MCEAGKQEVTYRRLLTECRSADCPKGACCIHCGQCSLPRTQCESTIYAKQQDSLLCDWNRFTGICNWKAALQNRRAHDQCESAEVDPSGPFSGGTAHWQYQKVNERPPKPLFYSSHASRLKHQPPQSSSFTSRPA